MGSMDKNYAATDPRSVRAMLENRDDGRSAAFEAFKRETLRKSPGISDEALGAAFNAAVANGWIARKRLVAVAVLAAFGVYVAAVTYGVFFSG